MTNDKPITNAERQEELMRLRPTPPQLKLCIFQFWDDHFPIKEIKHRGFIYIIDIHCNIIRHRLTTKKQMPQYRFVPLLIEYCESKGYKCAEKVDKGHRNSLWRLRISIP